MTQEMWIQLVTVLIPFITPLLTAGLKKIIPTLPKLVMVLINPILGAFIAAFGGIDPSTGAVLGAAGVGLREGIDQAKKLASRTFGNGAVA